LDKARKKRKKKSFSTIAMHEFEIIAKRHVVGWCLGGLRGFLLLPCLFFWGKSRGGRAARRILFELSWRLFGRKTYTAMGWPGRLFYKYS
jgi:spore maturation protein CgeB